MKINETTVLIFFPCRSVIWQAWVSIIHKKSDRFHVFAIIGCWHNYGRRAYYIHKVIRSITSSECVRDCCFALAVQFISYSIWLNMKKNGQNYWIIWLMIYLYWYIYICPLFYLHYLYISPLVFFIRLFYNLPVYFVLLCNWSVLSVVSVKNEEEKKKKAIAWREQIILFDEMMLMFVLYLTSTQC